MDIGLVDVACSSPWLGWREWEEREKMELCDEDDCSTAEGLLPAGEVVDAEDGRP